MKVKQKVKVGTVPETIWIFETKIVASQKTQYYVCRVAFNHNFSKILGRPYSSCECVVRRGPACSHQLAFVLIILTIVIVLIRLGDDLCWPTISKHLPDYIIVVQRTPTTVYYAYGKGDNPSPSYTHINLTPMPCTHVHTHRDQETIGSTRKASEV